MVAIRHVKTAAQQRVARGSISRTKKPRHVDNGLFGMSYIYRKVDNGRARWLTTDVLERTLRDKFYKDVNFQYKLGPQFQRCFDNMLPQLAAAGMIRFNNGNTKFRISKRMASIMTDAASEIEGLGINDAIQRHYAHCDYIRQKIGRFRPTLKALMEEIEELTETINYWDQHAKTCPLGPQRPGISRELSVVSSKTFNDGDILRTSDIDDDISMDGEPMTGAPSASSATPRQCSPPSNSKDSHDEAPIAGPSSAALATSSRRACSQNSEDLYDKDPIPGPSSAAPITPARHLSPPNPGHAYMTPESLPRKGAGTQTRSSSQPSPSPTGTSFATHDDSAFGDDMDVDDGPLAGLSSAPSPKSGDTLSSSSKSCAKCTELETNLVMALELVHASEPTLKSMEEAVQKQRQKQREAEKEKDREIEDLQRELGEQIVASNDKLVHLSNQGSQYAADYQTSSEELQELQDEFQVVKVLYYEARDEYDALLKEQQKKAEENVALLNRRQRLW